MLYSCFDKGIVNRQYDMNKIIVLGTGGHAKSIADTILSNDKYELAGFISENNSKNADYSYNQCDCVGCDDDLQDILDSGIEYAVIGIGFLGKGNVREKLYDTLAGIGYSLPALIDASASIAVSVKIMDGTFVGKNAVINADAQIGKMCIINSGAVIEHDCVIGDYSHVACGAVLCGGVTVGKNSLIGANSTVIEGINIPDNTIIPAGKVVTRKNINRILR